MISKINIHNFQSHKDTTLAFSPGVNVIVGASDSGKTSIIRALRWLIWNRPSGEEFRSHWGGETGVSIELENGIGIARVKEKENGYYLMHPDEVNEYKAFGTDVPEEVQKILNIDETNLQQQLDSPFLISKSPGEVAGYFNRIAHLDQIDASVKNIQSRIRTLTQEKQSDEARVKNLQDEIKQFNYLDKFEIELEVLEQLEKDWEACEKGRNKLELLLANVGEVKRQIEENEWIVLLAEPVDALLRLHTERDRDFEKLCTMQEEVSEIRKIVFDIGYLQKQTAVLPAVQSLLSLYDQKEAQETASTTISTIVDSIYHVNNTLLRHKLELAGTEELFHLHMPEQCPLCGK